MARFDTKVMRFGKVGIVAGARWLRRVVSGILLIKGIIISE